MKRSAKIQRVTGETQITGKLTIDGAGKADVKTGLPFFDHMLTLLAKHSLCDLKLRATGDLDVDAHHMVEDVGIALGEAFTWGLGLGLLGVTGGLFVATRAPRPAPNAAPPRPTTS